MLADCAHFTWETFTRSFKNNKQLVMLDGFFSIFLPLGFTNNVLMLTKLPYWSLSTSNLNWNLILHDSVFAFPLQRKGFIQCTILMERNFNSCCDVKWTELLPEQAMIYFIIVMQWSKSPFGASWIQHSLSSTAEQSRIGNNVTVLPATKMSPVILPKTVNSAASPMVRFEFVGDQKVYI